MPDHFMYAFRIANKSLSFLTALVIIAIATLNLSHVAAGPYLPLLPAAQCLAEIAIAVLSALVAAETASSPWRKVTFVFLSLLAAQRLWILWGSPNNDWSLTARVLHLALVAAPPFILILSLAFLLRSRHDSREIKISYGSVRTNSLLRGLARWALLLCAAVTLLFSAFELCIGTDLFGGGSAVVVTSLLAIAGALSTLLFALNPIENRRRTVTILLVSLTLAMRIARAHAISDVMLKMDTGGWTAMILVAIGPPVAILVVATVYPFVGECLRIGKASLLPTEGNCS